MKGQLNEMNRQYPEIKKSADAAESAAITADKTMKMAYRPRITLAGANPSVMQSEINGVLHTELVDSRLRVGIDLANTGPFAARNVRVFRFDNLGAKESAHKLPYVEWLGTMKTIQPTTTGNSGGFAVPGIRKVTSDEIRLLQSGKLWATFSVLIAYDDDFGQTHHTEYCDLFTLQPYNDICPWPVQND
jgi:hypothetical protein